MNTFWLKGRRERIALSELQCNSFSWAAPTSGPNPLLERRQMSTFSSLEDVRAASVDSTTKKSARGISSGRSSSAARMLKGILKRSSTLSLFQSPLGQIRNQDVSF